MKKEEVVSRQDLKAGRQWYVIHTTPGQEESVKRSIEQRIESENMQEYIFEVLIPKETRIILRRGKPVKQNRCIFSGYVFVDMIVTEESWGVITRSLNVRGFVGSKSIPIPVSPEEFEVIKNRIKGDQPKFKADFSKDDIVEIIDGPFATFSGTVSRVDNDKGKIEVSITVFGRTTPVELNFNQVRKK